MRVRVKLLAALAAAAALAGCGGGDERVVRLGYFATVSHATPIVGIADGTFAKELGDVRVEPRVFLSGPELMTALLAGDVDAGYVGPAPVIVAASRAPRRMWIAAGAAERGAQLIARRDSPIRGVSDLVGRDIAIPAFGNTQDLTLRMMLERIGERPAIDGGRVRMLRIRNGDLTNALRSRVVEAALAPEPWGTQLIGEGIARQVLGPGELLGARDELTTVLVVSGRLASRHPDRVAALVRANETATAAVAADPDAAVSEIQAEIRTHAGRDLPTPILRTALDATTPTTRLDPAVIGSIAAAASRAGYLAEPVDPADVLLPSPRD